MKKFYTLTYMAVMLMFVTFFPTQLLSNSNNNFSYYCDSTTDPVDVLPWLSDLIDEVNNNACFQDIAVYCYNGNVYFSPLSHPLIRCADVLYKTYDVHGDLYCQMGGLTGINSCPSNFGDATLIRTITAGSAGGGGGGGGGSSTLTVHCPGDIHVDCNNNSNVCWNPPTATTNCGTCPANNIPGYIYMGTFNGSKYYCSDGKATWEKAQAACEALGGYLACVTTSAENHYLANILVNQSAFIGGHDRNRDGHYNWISGESFGGYQNWYTGQPNNYRDDQYYIEMLPNGKWNDEYPTRKNEYICEIPCGGNSSPTISGPSANCGNFSVGTTPVTYTIKDDCGNQETCTFKVVVESSMNLTCPSDITVQATNHSGKNVSWNNPVINTCCSSSGYGEGGAISGFIYMGKYGSSHYYCSKDNASWQSAKSICESNGGHLAKITSAGENKFLADQLQTQSAWIGLSDRSNEGHFIWTDGSSIGSYQPWHPGQPNNYNGRQHYVELLNNGNWNDQYHYGLEYIMEIPAGNSINQVAGPHNGSTVSIGSHTVKYIAQDACGNSASCSFNVKVNPPVPSSGDYCSVGGHSASKVWIKKVQFANIWSQSGSNGGYKYFNSECGRTEPGDYVDLVLMPGFQSTVYTCYWLIYVDYNGDGDFTDRGEYVARGSGTSTLKGSIRIPPNVSHGKKRIRCVMKVGSWPSGPCDGYNYGETEDYCINIGEPVDECASDTSVVNIGWDNHALVSQQLTGGVINGNIPAGTTNTVTFDSCFLPLTGATINGNPFCIGGGVEANIVGNSASTISISYSPTCGGLIRAMDRNNASLCEVTVDGVTTAVNELAPNDGGPLSGGDIQLLLENTGVLPASFFNTTISLGSLEADGLISGIGQCVTHNGAHYLYSIPCSLNISEVSFKICYPDGSYMVYVMKEIDTESSSSSNSIQTESRTREEYEPVVLSNNESSIDKVKVYPNPTTGVINIVTEGNRNISTIEVFDQSGRKVLARKSDSSEQEIDLSSYATGLYFIRTIYNDGNFTTNKISLIK